jgi:hypothetical protein
MREHGNPARNDRRGVVTRVVVGGMWREYGASPWSQHLGGADLYRADEDLRSLFAEDRSRGILDDDRQLLSANGSGHAHDLRGPNA